jgi:hypothetical protein
MVLMATNGAIIAIGANCGTPLVTMAPLASMVTMETIVRRVGIGKGRRKRKNGETVRDQNRDWGQSEEGAMNSLNGERLGGLAEARGAVGTPLDERC